MSGVVLGLARDVPYTATIGVRAIGYLGVQHPPLALVVAGLILVMLGLLEPLVARVRGYVYPLRLKGAQVNNVLHRQWAAHPEAVFPAWDGWVETSYQQALWTVPVTALAGQLPGLGLLAVAALAVTAGGRPATPVLLSTVFLVNYATAAWHGLYQRWVAWQTLQPAVVRLQDFLEGAE
ncbi:MAG: hypothetical protein OWV35_04860 [Firmicutes bacterium]|nr:hypothetical protein [Bacillota bacterium]